MKVKRTKLLCSVCGEPQANTPHGLVCENGHGGADSLEKPEPKVERSIGQRARNLVFDAIGKLRDRQSDVMMRASLSSIARKVLHGKPADGQCCQWEDRDPVGGCRNCGDLQRS